MDSVGSHRPKIQSRKITYTHHEHWDGKDYPQGLKGNQIPITGRLMAIADVYDALISKRIYKEAFSHQRVVEIVSTSAGNHLDPDMVEAFLQIEDKMLKVAAKYSDGEIESAPGSYPAMLFLPAVHS
ncbi:MAG: HD domain-containing phosphohydrolase [Candidatus Thiodiazotropha lotti]